MSGRKAHKTHTQDSPFLPSRPIPAISVAAHQELYMSIAHSDLSLPVSTPFGCMSRLILNAVVSQKSLVLLEG